MTIIFKAKSCEGYVLKVLAELLQNNIKTACFEVDAGGIKLKMMDFHRTILIDLELDAHTFTIYKFLPTEKLDLGINLAHFHKMLKSIKKKDSLEFSIDDETPTELGIKVIPKEGNRVTKSCIKIQQIQNIDIDMPSGYGNPVIVPSAEFQKMCKGLGHISNITHIATKGFLIRFSSDAGGVMKRYTELGEYDDDEADHEPGEQKWEHTDYSEEFDTEQLTRITKLSALSPNMQIYSMADKPLLFRCPVGNLGKISVYLKSKNLQEIDSKAVEDEDN